MGLREIRQRIRKLGWRLLMGTVEDVPERNQIFESGSHATAFDWERSGGSDRRLGIPREVDGQVAGSSASMQRKTDIAASASAPAKKHLCAGDIARGILGPNSGASISNVLVVGTNGSTPLKRMEIHFDDPEQVTAFFKLLAAALKNSGFDFHAARSSGIPATEIWLTCPLDGRKKTLLSCAGLIEEQVAAGIAIEAGSPREQTE